MLFFFFKNMRDLSFISLDFLIAAVLQHIRIILCHFYIKYLLVYSNCSNQCYYYRNYYCFYY